MTIENIENHMAYTCQCGGVNFALLKSGAIECNKCSTPLDDIKWWAGGMGAQLARAIKAEAERDALKAALPVGELTDEQIKAHGDKASTMMARDMTRFDAACEVMKYLKETHAPYYYSHRMQIVLHGNDEGTEAARAPDKAILSAARSQPVLESLTADMFWNHDDAEQLYSSIEEFLNDEICNGAPLEVGHTRTIQRAVRLSNLEIRITSIDEESCDAEYEVVHAALGIKQP